MGPCDCPWQIEIVISKGRYPALGLFKSFEDRFVNVDFTRNVSVLDSLV